MLKYHFINLLLITNTKLFCTILFCLRYGFGLTGNAGYAIPGGATLQYKIKMTTFEKVQLKKGNCLIHICFFKS